MTSQIHKQTISNLTNHNMLVPFTHLRRLNRFNRWNLFWYNFFTRTHQKYKPMKLYKIHRQVHQHLANDNISNCCNLVCLCRYAFALACCCSRPCCQGLAPRGCRPGIKRARMRGNPPHCTAISCFKGAILQSMRQTCRQDGPDLAWPLSAATLALKYKASEALLT